MVTAHSLHDAMLVDFLLACADLTEARCGRIDEEDRRRRLAEATLRIDALLDMHLQAQSLERRDPPPGLLIQVDGDAGN